MKSRLSSLYVSSLDGSQSIDPQLEQLIESATARLQAGESLDLGQLIADHPSYADQLRELLPMVASLVGMGNAPIESADDAGSNGRAAMLPHKELGDFRLIREIGRGGMGTVFEAEQLSMGRRVALKVLPFAALAHDKSLQRFRNEVRAAAALDHPHIVSVYSVGEERGVHYYAMQLIRGQSLADMIAELRNSDRVPGDRHPGDSHQVDSPTIDSPVDPPPSTKPDEQVRISTAVDSRHAAEFYRSAARLGIQAAEALQHAHDQGVLHRDIKPGNLMLDAEGQLYITDFGLARIEADAGLTMTGDMLGTLRYMAPEQALAKRVVIDHRADVYSLGATLYELLTLHPAFGETDRSELLKQIAFDEPRPLRKLHRHIPAELETIVLKAMAKSPDERYLTAERLADDLRAYLEHRPIKAKPPTPLQRIGKWSRRHVGVVWSLLLGSLLAAAVLGVSTVLIAQSRNDADEQRLLATSEKDKAVDQRNVAITQRNKARLNQYYAEIVSGQTDWDRGNIGGVRSKLAEHLPITKEPDYRGWEWYYLWSLCHPEMRTLHHDYRLVCAACSPDGDYIGAPGNIWRSDSGERIRRYDLSRVGSSRVAWSPDGQKFAWCKLADENAFYVWDRVTDSVDRIAGHESSVWCVDWSPDGKQIASGSLDNTVKIWDWASKRVTRTIPAKCNVMNVGWSPDSKLLAAGVHYYGVMVWDPDGGNVVADLPQSDEDLAMLAISWHPSGKFLAVASDRRWFLLDRADWKPRIEHPLARGGQAIACSPDGAQIAVTDGETLAIWGADGKQQVAGLKGHKAGLMSISWARDSRRIVTSSNDGEIKLWDRATPMQPDQISFDASVDSIAWQSDNKTLVAVKRPAGATFAWNTADGTLNTHKTDIENPLCLSANRRYAAKYLHDESAVAILDAESGDTCSVLRIHSDSEARAGAFSPDDSKLAVATIRGTNWTLEIWDVNTESRVASWEAKGISGTHLHHAITWSNDGSQVALIGPGDLGDDGTHYWADHLHVIAVSGGKRLLKHCASGEIKSKITCLAWSPDGKSMAFGTPEGYLEVVRIETLRTLFSAKVHNSGINKIAWHPAGNRLACGTNDGSVLLVSAADGHRLLSFSRSDNSEMIVAWSPDGKRLAAATKLGSSQVWDATRGYEFTVDGPRRGELAREYYHRARSTSQGISSLALQRMLNHAPDTLDFWFVRGHALARLGEFNRAADEFSKVVSANPRFSFQSAANEALCLLAMGDVKRYRQATASLVALVRESNVPSSKGYVAWLGALTQNPLVNSKEILSFAEANRNTNERDGGDEATLAVAACLVRSGDIDQAVRSLTALADKLDEGGDSVDRYELACSQYFLALARHELGQDFQARRFRAMADRECDEFKRLSTDWQRTVILAALNREVATVIGEPGDK